MIHAVRFLIKLTTQLVVMPIIGFGLILMALIFWDERYMNWGEEIQDSLWKPKESFAKYRFINNNTGRILYEMLLNNELTCDEQQERLSKKNQELANRAGVEYGDIFFEHLGDS